MASPVLHIKDSYYFEVPKALWRSDRRDIEAFPPFWIQLDPDFQLWQAKQVYAALADVKVKLPPEAELLHEYEHWKEHGHNFGKPFARFIEEAKETAPIRKQLAGEKTGTFNSKWTEIKENVGDLKGYMATDPHWSKAKIAQYNSQLDGKILIPQPFGTLNNLYEAKSGFAISKFMLIELVVAVVLVAIFARLAGKIRLGSAPRGRLVNMFESVLLFIRDDIARPAIGAHDADRFVPLLWTIFLFVLGCNLFGMLPWMGAPTGAFGTTTGVALVTLATVFTAGMLRFGFIGFWKNQIPGMDLPLVLAVLIKPLIFVIEVAGLLIRHAVLAVRLLANMVAGHVVLLGIMVLAFSIAGAESSSWGLTAVISIVGSVLFSCLELFVAFLQAYIFTFLSALFIGASVHHH